MERNGQRRKLFLLKSSRPIGQLSLIYESWPTKKSMLHIDMGREDFKRNNSLALMASISEMTKQRACIKLVEVHRFENEVWQRNYTL